jgi:hypothetical protein
MDMPQPSDSRAKSTGCVARACVVAEALSALQLQSLEGSTGIKHRAEALTRFGDTEKRTHSLVPRQWEKINPYPLEKA